MQLTPHYRYLQAMFERPEGWEPSPGPWSDIDVQYNFRLGLFDYQVNFYWVLSGRYDVSFKLKHIYGTDQELADYLSKVFGRKLYPAEVREFRKNAIIRPYNILRTGNAVPVLTRVIQTIKDFIHKYHPHKIQLSSDELSRTDLYRRMLRRFFPSYKIDEIEGLGPGITSFVINLEPGI